MKGLGIVAAVLAVGSTAAGTEPLRIATFQVDATPPIGAALCNGNTPPAVKIADPLSIRGVVLLVEPAPLVLCSIDWTGIGNGTHLFWREALADAARTTPDRVAVQTGHQHDAPGCDLEVEELLAPRGLGGKMCDVAFVRTVISRTADAVREAMKRPRTVTHMGMGAAKVERIASNRRIVGPDGKVQHVRLSACKDAAAVAAPEGIIDPLLRTLSFWDGGRPIAALTYYACHGLSFYGHGAMSADFVGIARGLRDAAVPSAMHICFDGAGGNVAAGKYNDGTPIRRLELAARLADAMERAWATTEKQPVAAQDVRWTVRPVRLPLREGWSEERATKTLDDASRRDSERVRAARDIVWIRRCRRADTIDLTCLSIGRARVLHLPGEPFVEYQLAAAQMASDAFVCVAGYGDYGPGYIGTAAAYEQGGYETGPVSRVSPKSEAVLLQAMRELLR